MTEPEINWLRADEPSDVVSSVRHALRLLDFIEDDKTVWKWVIIATHSALQGAMVCHLSGTAQLGCLSSKSAKAWLEWNEKDRHGEINSVYSEPDEFGIRSRHIVAKADRAPRNYMAKPDDLFERLYNNQIRIELSCGAILVISDSQKSSFKMLNGFRNKFTHFTPTIWSIEISGLPQIIGDIFDIIARIASDDWPFRHLEQQNRTELLMLLTDIKSRLAALSEKAPSKV